jgi:outer membrane immunogenic protein
VKRNIFVCATVLLFLATPAFAADITSPVYKAQSTAQAFNWNGVYAGVALGGRWPKADWTTTGIPTGVPGQVQAPDPTTAFASFDSATFKAGGYLGYNFQIQSVILGLEGDIYWGHNSKTIAGIPGTFGTGGQGVGPAASLHDSANMTLGWDASIRGRVGYLVAPNWLVFATGGVGWQQIDVNATCDGTLQSWCIAPRNETYSMTKIGWIVGGGVEALIWQNWLLRAEYRYADYGSIDHTFFATAPSDFVVSSQSIKTHTALIGLAYKFLP